MPSVVRINVPWTTIHAAIEHLAQELKDDDVQVEAIVGISRGGLCPAVLLSSLLGCSEVVSTVVQFRDGSSGPLPGKLDISIGKYNKPGTLVLDDLWDTGRTFKWLRRYLPHPTYACLFHKSPEARDIINYPGQALTKDQWVVFPWEVSHG